MKMKNIVENIYLFSDENSRSENVTVILTEEGPVVIDAFNSSEQWKVVDAFIKEAGYEGPKALIYTHWHLDHTVGHYLTFKENYPIYAHEKAKQYLSVFKERYLNRFIAHEIVEPTVNIIFPTHTFSNTYTLSKGSYTFELVYIGGHTEDSIIIFERKTRVLFVGDVLMSHPDRMVVPPSLPIDYGVDYMDLFKSMKKIKQRIQSDSVSHIIPGHGMKTDPRILFQQNEEYFQSLHSFVQTEIQKGRREDWEKVNPAHVFPQPWWEGALDKQQFHVNLRKIYQYLTK